MSVDFLLGIGIFLLTFGFILQFIPGLFLTTSGDESLNSVSYRTAEILVADPGWWENSTHNGTDWENHTGDISRIGFAYDITPSTKQTLTPNILDKNKIQMAQGLNQSELRNKLGLYYKISNSQIDYGYNITIELDNSTLSFGETPPISQDVFRIKRQVLVETGNITLLEAEELKNNSINISENPNENMIIQITNFSITGSNARFNQAKVNTNFLDPSLYEIKKRTNITNFRPFNPIETLNSTDTLRFVFNQSFPVPYPVNLKLYFDNMSFPAGTPYVYPNIAQKLYEPASFIVEVWK